MFAGIRNFLYRHKRKFFLGGGIIGGLVLLSKYAEFKLFKLHDSQTRELIEKQKRRQHFEKTRQTANATVLSLSNSITKILSDELEIEEILHLIRANPDSKMELWHELKVFGVSRCVASIYIGALVGAIVHAKLMLLGGYSYGSLARAEAVKITDTDEAAYLAHLQNFVEDGLPLLINKIRKASHYRVQSLHLDHQITLEQLEGILKDIILSLDGEDSNYSEIVKTFRVQPWSQYITKINISVPNCNNLGFTKMTEELADVVDGEDFNFVVQSLVQHGLNHIIDYVADFYPQPTIEPCVNGKIGLTEITTNTETSEDASLSNSVSSEEESLTVQKPSSFHSSVMRTAMPLAKLVPVLSDMVRPCLSPAPGHLLQFVLLNEQLENLSFNIYEAFSVSS